MMNRRVVVTGLGLISPLGNDLASSWAAALEGKSGIARITGFDASEFGCQIAGEVKGFDAGKYLDVKEVRRFDKFVHFGVGAGLMALEDSGLEVTEENAPMIGVAIGAGIGGLPSICANNDAMVSRGPRRISPFMIPGCIINMTSGQLAIMKGLKGPNIAHVTACSTGLHAIGEAAYIIARGDADVMLAGGTESTVCKLGIGGFDAMHAKARGAKIYAEIAGYGLSGDAHHITTPSTDGPVRCMRMALRHAGMNPDEIDYLNAHGTSTSVGDANEVKAIREVFGDHAARLAVNSTKSMTGHLLGGAGGIESVFSVMAIRDQVSPPTINLDNLDPECAGVDIVGKTARQMKIRAAMKNSFGFGGTNSTVIYKAFAD